MGVDEDVISKTVVRTPQEAREMPLLEGEELKEVRAEGGQKGGRGNLVDNINKVKATYIISSFNHGNSFKNRSDNITTVSGRGKNNPDNVRIESR